MVSALGYNQMTNIAEHIVAAVVASAVIFLIWISLWAEPLVIEKYEMVKTEVSPGQIVKTKATGRKPWWSVEFCTALMDVSYLQDDAGQIAQSRGPVNFNDGTIKRVANEIRIPKRMEGNELLMWKRVVYRCFGFFEKTVTSPKSSVRLLT